MLGPFPLPTGVFYVCKMLSNCLCAKTLHRKKFHRVLSCHHSERGAGKTHGWNTNNSQSRFLGQTPDVFGSCSFEGMKTTQLVYRIKGPVTTTLFYQLEPRTDGSSKATWVLHHHAIHQLHTPVFLYYCY